MKPFPFPASRVQFSLGFYKSKHFLLKQRRELIRRKYGIPFGVKIEMENPRNRAKEESWSVRQAGNSITDFFSILYQLYFEMSQAISKITMVNADNTTKEYSEQSERMRQLFVKSVLFAYPKAEPLGIKLTGIQIIRENIFH